MYYSSIFQQLFKFIPRYRFEKSVKNLSGDRYCKKFSAWQQFLTCLYAQITGKDSLREIVSGLATNHQRLYHLGMTAVAKSTLADAMNRRWPVTAAPISSGSSGNIRGNLFMNISSGNGWNATWCCAGKI